MRSLKGRCLLQKVVTPGTSEPIFPANPGSSCPMLAGLGSIERSVTGCCSRIRGVLAKGLTCQCLAKCWVDFEAVS